MGSSPYPFTHTSTNRNASTWTCPSTLKPPPCTGQTITRTGSICLSPSSERRQSSKKTDERRNDESTIEIGCETTSLEDQSTNHTCCNPTTVDGMIGVCVATHVSNQKRSGCCGASRIANAVGVLLLFKRPGAVEYPGSSSLRRR